ncbi:unnamed protein product [Allacma fusca]|uniref:SIAH-type domain-containing protein n=1 Tax=Allacma fusca TaxID=39272 RepID=A0A8J2JA15_9HEXA|nr:unnamed protein product [Allacma fusca]
MAGYCKAMTVPGLIPGSTSRQHPNILRSPSDSAVGCTSLCLPKSFPGPYGPQYRALLHSRGIGRQVRNDSTGTGRSIQIQINNELYQDQSRDENLQLSLVRANKRSSHDGNCPECEIERAKNSVTIEEISEELDPRPTSYDDTKITEVSSPSSADSEVLVMDIYEEMANTWVAYPTTNECKIRLRRESPKYCDSDFEENEFCPASPGRNNSSEGSSTENTCTLIEIVKLRQGNDEYEFSPSKETTEETRSLQAEEARICIDEVGDLDPDSCENPSSSSATETCPTPILVLPYDPDIQIQPKVYSLVEPPSYYAKQHWKKILLQMFIRKEKPSVIRKKSSSKKETGKKIKPGQVKTPASSGIRKMSLQGIKIADVNDLRKRLRQEKLKTSKKERTKRCLRSNSQEVELASLPSKLRTCQETFPIIQIQSSYACRYFLKKLPHCASRFREIDGSNMDASSSSSSQVSMNTERSNSSPESFRVGGKCVKDMDRHSFKHDPNDQRNGRSGFTKRQYTIACFSTQDHETREGCIKLMRCSFCKEICPPADSQVCEHGHLTCNTCLSRVIKCTFESIDEDGKITLCLTSMSALKLVMYEYIYETLDTSFRCENWNQGCSAVVKSEEMKAHRNQCPYRPEIGCPFTDCEVGEMTCEGLIRHLTAEHGSNLVTGNSQKITISFKSAPESFRENYSWTPAVFQMLDHHFLLTMLQKAGCMSILFYRLERKKSRQNHIIEMKIVGNDKESMYKREYTPRDFNLPSTALKSGLYTQSLDSFMSTFVEMADGKNFIDVVVTVINNNPMF